MSKYGKNKMLIRVISIVLAGLMVIGVGTTAIFVIINLFGNDGKKDSAKICETFEIATVDDGWTV